jgi:hypothetical protein
MEVIAAVGDGKTYLSFAGVAQPKNFRQIRCKKYGFNDRDNRTNANHGMKNAKAY